MNILDDMKRVAGEIGTDVLTRSQYRMAGNYSDHAIVSQYGSFKAAKRAAGLEPTVGARLQNNALARHVDHDGYRQMNIEKADYATKYTKPKGTRFQTMLVASDIHDEECDPFWRRVFIDSVARVQPDTVVLGGDIFDLAEFGRYSVDPREWNIVAKIKWVHEFLGDIREAAADTEIVFIEGNHEHRLLRYLTDNAPALKALLSDLHGWTVPKLLGLDKFEVRYVARADLATFNKSNVVKEIAKNYEVFHDCFLVDHFPDGRNKGVPGVNGHHHQHVVHSEYSHLFGSYEWHQLGCGHKRAASYCAGEKWNMGFMTVTIDTQNKLPLMDYHFIGDFALVHGKHYIRGDNE
jgi:Homing endonuclease associated repeat